MHAIDRLRVRNLGPISDATFELASYTPLIGMNNSGKSTLINAIAWVLSKTSLQVEQFGNKEVPIDVAALITGLNDSILRRLTDPNRRRLEPYIENETLWYRLKQISPGATVASIQVSVCRPSEYREDSDDAWTNPAGIAEAIKGILPHVLQVEAMDDASSEVAKFKQGNTLGKLLGEISDSFTHTHGEELATTMSRLESWFDADGADRSQVVQEMDIGATAALAEFFPGIEVKLHISPPTLKELFQSATLKCAETGAAGSRHFSSFGHGTQRSIVMALLRYLAELKAPEANGVRTILLIDEPELYLHPQAIDLVASALRKLSKGRYQVVFSTHSPMTISREDAADAILMYRKADHSVAARTKIRKTIRDFVNDHDHQSELLFQLTTSRDLLFSRRILFVEGKTETHLIPHLLEIALGNTLSAMGVSVVQLGGISNLAGVRNIVNALGIDACFLADFDFVMKGSITAGIIRNDSEHVIVLRDRLRALAAANNRISLQEGLPYRAKGSENLKSSEVYELLAQDALAIPSIISLHDQLLEARIWLWKKGAVERHLGATSKEVSEWSRILEMVGREGLASLPDENHVQELAEWIRQ